MDTRTGETDDLTTDQVKEITERMGRPPEPGDKLDEHRVIISGAVARKLAIAQNEEHRRERERRRSARRRAAQQHQPREKGRARRKRAEARRRSAS